MMCNVMTVHPGLLFVLFLGQLALNIASCQTITCDTSQLSNIASCQTITCDVRGPCDEELWPPSKVEAFNQQSCQ